MSARKSKSEIVTFKVDESLFEAMSGIPNRSDFIRQAVLAALESTCPLCRGTGALNHHQRDHWEYFKRDHSLEKCDDCHELYLVCSKQNSSG
ncbi:MAG: ribbon-helix-helix domain-containing protein [candidate division Zixibacteria bacterium]|nr:ribbon-helix-helix domain-containing protein [candidate division Zixibacteria bacterium]